MPGSTRMGVAVATAIALLAIPTPAMAGSSNLETSPDPAWDAPPAPTLAGFTLPMDWSQRTSPCPRTADAPHLEQRLASFARPALCPGDVSEAVVHLQRLLTEKKLYRQPITGVYDTATRYAVAAFHKVIGPAHPNPATAVAEWRADPPPEDWTPEDWLLLEAFEPRPPKFRRNQPDRVESDIGHQVLYLIHDDEVVAIMPISTGAGRGTRGCTSSDTCSVSVTPRTSRMVGGSTFFGEHGYSAGWSPRPGDWSIYKAIFYRGQYGEWNYGLHGYRHVPHYPASHGCTRLTVWDMDFLRPTTARGAADSRVWVGMTIHVWDE